jgi:hypothetical protein
MNEFAHYAGKWIALLGKSGTVIAADSNLSLLPALVESRGVNFSEVEVMRIEEDGEILIDRGSDVEFV